jgi:hypothetical protein
MALYMPLAACGETWIIEWGCVPVDTFVENEPLVSAANPVFVRIWVADERTQILGVPWLVFYLLRYFYSD